MSEELALDEGLGDRPAVDDPERLVLPLRSLVEEARNALLARAALAGDEDGAPPARDALHELEDALHRRRAPEQVLRLMTVDLSAEARVLLDERALLERLADERAQLGGGERLRDEVVRAALHRVDRRLHGGVGGHHDDLRVGRDLLGDRDDIEPGAVRHHQVGEDDAVGLRRVLERVARRREAGRGRDGVALPPEEDRQHLAESGLVVDDEDGAFCAHWSSTIPGPQKHIAQTELRLRDVCAHAPRALTT